MIFDAFPAKTRHIQKLCKNSGRNNKISDWDKALQIKIFLYLPTQREISFPTGRD
jgi:hypothetical protein